MALAAVTGLSTHIETCEASERVGAGVVEIFWGSPRLKLNGNYEARLMLTKADIANLARIAFDKDPFGEEVAVLSKQESVREGAGQA